MEKWGKAKKKPIEIHFRKVVGNVEVIHTLEGDLTARSEHDYIIKGVNGEEYPIRKQIFHQTYDITEPIGVTIKDNKDTESE